MDTRAHVAAAVASGLPVVIRLEVTQEGGEYTAHIEKYAESDGAHFKLSSDPQPTPMIAIGQMISMAWHNKELGP